MEEAYDATQLDVAKKKRVQHRKPMPTGFWKREDVGAILKDAVASKLTMRVAAEKLTALGCGDVDEMKTAELVAHVKKGTYIFTPGRKDLEIARQRRLEKKEFGANNDPDIAYADLREAINWSEFLGIDGPQLFDLQVICSMFYASEKIITQCKTARKLTPELRDIYERSQEYVKTWAERFGKYTLASCLGEFRHRRVAGTMKLVPQGRGKVSRAAAQRAAMILWPYPEKVKVAAEYLVEKFKDHSFFQGGGVGGPAWSKIAKTFQSWYTKAIPDVVFADYVWDLSHNGGRFFDKCELFANEFMVRKMLTVKRSAKDLEWAKPWLHSDWVRGLELAEIAAMDSGKEVWFGGDA